MAKRKTPTIVYDGECPFCSWYVDHLSSSASIDAIDARQDPDLVAELASMNISIDRNMALLDEEAIYEGADALHRLALQEDIFAEDKPTGFFYRSLQNMFARRLLANMIYPPLRWLRLVYLRLTGRQTIVKK